MSARSALAALATAVALVALPACGSGSGSGGGGAASPEAAGADTTTASAPDLTGVTLRVGDQFTVTKTLLEASGQLAGTPYQVEFTNFASGPPLVDAIRADAIDVGGVGDTPPIFGQAGGVPLQIIGAIKGSGENQAIVVPAGSTIRSVADLEGRSVAYTEGSSANAFLVLALEKAGLTLDDIDPVKIQPADALSAFNGGQVDAWVIWDPYLAIAESGGATTVATSADVGGTFTYEIASDGALADAATAAAIGDLLTRLTRAYRWQAQNGDAWAETFAGLTGLPPALAKVYVGRSGATFVPIGDEVRDSQQRIADALAAAGVIPSKIDVSEVLDDRYDALLPTG
jgi:sulfonate transport system substrate-binding protein